LELSKKGQELREMAAEVERASDIVQTAAKQVVEQAAEAVAAVAEQVAEPFPEYSPDATVLSAHQSQPKFSPIGANTASSGNTRALNSPRTEIYSSVVHQRPADFSDNPPRWLEEVELAGK
jgi:hypothetical protein